MMMIMMEMVSDYYDEADDEDAVDVDGAGSE